MKNSGHGSFLAGMLDQALQSGANFCLTLVMARLLDTHAFGLLAMGQALALYAGTLHTSLIAEPFSVNAAQYQGPELTEYLLWNNRLHLFLCIATFGILAIAAGLSHLAGRETGGGAFWCAALSVPGYLNLWYTRRVCYALNRQRQALAGTFAYLAALTSGLLLASRLYRLDPFSVSAVFTLSACLPLIPVLSLPPGIAGNRNPLPSSRWRILHWNYARWHLGGNIISGLGQFIAYPILAWSGGMGSSGALRIVEMIFTPINQGMTSLALVITPTLAKLRHADGIAAMQAYLARWRRILALGLCLALGIMLVLGDRLTIFLFGKARGTGLGLVAVFFGLTLLLRILVDFGPAMILRLTQNTRAFFVNGWISGLAGTLLSGAGGALGGLPGIVGARVLTSALSGVVFARHASHHTRGNPL